jgi:hypothetical protein
MAGRLLSAFETCLDLRGNPVSGAALRVTRAGTTDLATLFRDGALTVPMTNPTSGVDLSNAAGRVPSIFCADGIYDVEAIYPVPVASEAPAKQLGVEISSAVVANGNSIQGVAGLRAYDWGASRPTQITIPYLQVQGDGGGDFAWDALATNNDDGRWIIKEAATAVGRWKRKNIGDFKQRPRARSGFENAASMIGRQCTMTRASNQAVADNLASNVIWDTTSYDDISGVYSSSNPERLTIPTHLDGAKVVVSACMTFAANATGTRAVEIQFNGATSANGARQSSANAGTQQTSITVSTRPIRAQAGNYFNVTAFQNSGAALDVVTAGGQLTFTIEVVRNPPSVRNQNGLVLQGSYQNLAPTPAAFGAALAQCSVVLLSHPPFTVNDTIFPVATGPSGCLDTPYDGWAEAVRVARGINPSIVIAGYVSAGADAPINTTCGYTHPPGTPWTAAGVPNVTAWIGKWAALPEDVRPNMIFFDLVVDKSNGGWISPTVRDDCYAAARAAGFGIAVNTTNSSFINVAFGAQGLSAGDIIVIEGFDIAAGAGIGAATDAAMLEARKYRARGVTVYALATSAWGVAPTLTERINAIARFNSWAEEGDTLSVQSADLGLTRLVIDVPVFGVQL